VAVDHARLRQAEQVHRAGDVLGRQGRPGGRALGKRFEQLIPVREIGERKARQFRSGLSGTRRRALVVDDGWSAVTDNYLKVRLGAQHGRNEWVDVVV